MHKKLHDVIDVVAHQLSKARSQHNGKDSSGGTYRSSRDTAARALRYQDAQLLGLPADSPAHNNS